MFAITNAFSIDVEEYFQVSAFEGNILREDWDKYPSNINENIDRILLLLDNCNVKATFFVLGWIAEKHSGMVRKISDLNHEVASHGYSHVRVINQNAKEFKKDIIKTKNILEDITGREVLGYRAASYSINKENQWAHEIIQETGHSYSSSIYPIVHDLYGIPDACRFPYKPCDGELLEIPISTFQLFKKRIPCGGGGFFRLYPYILSRSMINYINKREGKPCVFYFHPWEIDSKQPRIKNLNFKTRFRHYLNIDKTEKRLGKLLSDFNWDTMLKVYLGH